MKPAAIFWEAVRSAAQTARFAALGLLVWLGRPAMTPRSTVPPSVELVLMILGVLGIIAIVALRMEGM